MPIRFRRAALSLAALLPILGVVVGACGADDDPATPAAAPPPCFQSTAALMRGYQQAYEMADEALFAATLHDSFAFELLDATQVEFPALGPVLDRNESLASAASMFSGDPITNHRGDLVPGVTAIAFAVFEQQSGWSAVPAGQAHAGTQMALFDLVVTIYRDRHTQLRVAGPLKVHVVATAEAEPCWQLRAIVDLTGGLKSSENVPFGAVQALYWTGTGP